MNNSETDALVPSNADTSAPTALTHSVPAPSPAATLPTAATRPPSCMHPASRFYDPNTGIMYPIGFGLRWEVLHAIARFVYQSDGLQKMKEFVRSGFLGQWSVEAQRFEQQKAASASEVANLESEQRRVVKLLSDTPLTRVEATVRIPSGAARLGFVCLVTSLVFLSLLAVANAAAYLRFLTQGWLVAVLMVAPLLFVALPVKYVMGKLGDKGRRRLGWIIACLGVVAFFGFLFTLSARANEPSCADVLNGTAGLGARLVPWQLAAQVLLETVIAAALWCWIINLTVTSSRQVQNSDVAMLAAERDRLQEGINAARKRLAEAMGNLSELSHSLEYWLCYAETIYHAYSERERRLAECLVPVRDWPRTAGI